MRRLSKLAHPNRYAGLCLIMEISLTFPNNPRNAKLPYRECFRSGVCFHGSGCVFGKKLCSQSCSVHVAKPFPIRNLRRVAWHIRSNVDGSGLDPSPSSRSDGGTRLVRAIQALQTRLAARLRELRKVLPIKLFFFLVGFYCATAFATVIGQTGDWDILSAALAVAIVEGIGALMYNASFPLFSSVRGLITMFNYWKAGLALGLFLDSFKY